MSDAPKSLAAKLAEVMAVVKRIPKRGKNEFHGYKYATEADLADAIRDELSSRGVILIPDVQTVERIDTTPTAKGKPQFLTNVEIKWTFTDGTDSISFMMPGCGIDGEDKGIYKAITGAEKYALMKFFLVPTGDDPEADSRKKGEGEKSPFIKGKLTELKSFPTCSIAGVTKSDGKLVKVVVTDTALDSRLAAAEGKQVTLEISEEVGKNGPYLELVAIVSLEGPATITELLTKSIEQVKEKKAKKEPTERTLEVVPEDIHFDPADDERTGGLRK